MSSRLKELQKKYDKDTQKMSEEKLEIARTERLIGDAINRTRTLGSLPMGTLARKNLITQNPNKIATAVIASNPEPLEGEARPKKEIVQWLSDYHAAWFSYDAYALSINETQKEIALINELLKDNARYFDAFMAQLRGLPGGKTPTGAGTTVPTLPPLDGIKYTIDENGSYLAK